MIKLFRNIRQNIIKDQSAGLAGNRVRKYMLYAIGEIILVVIGILIALQINNWNNDAANKREEQRIVNNLNFEFKKNRINLQEDIKHHKKSYPTPKTL